ncbi:MAG: DnaT-like ssDNA-binding domain-containing protein [Proteobacteria bacterium]|nr:DnaT-like ssDNA-binding domain-containing protein [Pseudomonadota bacterium]MDA1351381.1 DnaT-like ssDNA-binding domain-containing protein [Pseudomonadota bacterium]
MSLIPEKPIVISPTLAATIGLEETVLLQLMQECISHGSPVSSSGFDWITLPANKLLGLAPFWGDDDFRRLSASLHEKGLLLIGGGPFTANHDFRFAFNENSVAISLPSSNRLADISAIPESSKPHSAKTIGGSWRPSEDALRQLAQLGVSKEFAQQQIPQFVTYWRERNVPRHSWESKYIKEVWRQWQQSETTQNRRRKEISVTGEWRPSLDALDILVTKGGINTNFIEDAIPEFILYWRDRGDLSSTWDSKFIQHIRRQWQFFNGMMEEDSMPRLISAQWKPKEAVYNVLQMANIDRQFASNIIPEFVLYWQENGTPQCSWSTKFLQYVKRQWAHQNKSSTEPSNGKQQGYSKGRIRDRSFVEDLTDRSWAS